MASVAVLVPYPEMRELAQGLFSAYPQLVPFCVEHVQNNQVEGRAAELEKRGCDIIMARGLHAIKIKRSVKLPVVEIRVTAQELGELVLDIRDEIGAERPKIGLIGFENMLCDTSRFDRLYAVELRRYLVSGTVDTENALQAAVRKAVRDGCQAVLGGKVVCETAADMGLCHRFIPGSKESLRAAFDLAKHIGYAIDQEKRNRAEIEAMLNATLDGIIRINAEGIVLWANASACRLLNASREKLPGKQISTAFPALNGDILEKALSDENEAYAVLRLSGKREIIVNAVSIRAGSQTNGALLTLREGRRVVEMNDELHREMYRRGYLAHWKFENLPMRSAEGQRLIQRAKQFSRYGAPVLLEGETGSGKGILAQCIYNENLEGAFFILDCQAYRSETLDFLLFGSPQDNAPCLAEAACNGTIYLSHVESLSPDLQYKLLLLLRGGFTRNGSRYPQTASVRVVASAETSLMAKVEQGKFRGDLYYALSVLQLSLKPLRECREDILPWVEVFLQRSIERHRRPIRLTRDAQDFLSHYDWPGNLIQVQSLCEQMALLSQRQNVNEGFLRFLTERTVPKFLPGSEQIVIYRDEEGEKIAALLEQCGGNRRKAAAALGISTTTLWRRMKKYGVGKDFSE